MANLLADVPETELFAEEQLKPIGSETCPLDQAVFKAYWLEVSWIAFSRILESPP